MMLRSLFAFHSSSTTRFISPPALTSLKPPARPVTAFGSKRIRVTGIDTGGPSTPVASIACADTVYVPSETDSGMAHENDHVVSPVFAGAVDWVTPSSDQRIATVLDGARTPNTSVCEPGCCERLSLMHVGFAPQSDPGDVDADALEVFRLGVGSTRRGAVGAEGVFFQPVFVDAEAVLGVIERALADRQRVGDAALDHLPAAGSRDVGKARLRLQLRDDRARRHLGVRDRPGVLEHLPGEV